MATIQAGAQRRPVTIDEDAGRFEIDLGSSGVGEMVFRRRGSVLSILHTGIPESMRGQGIGGALVRAGLDYARSRGWTIEPHCPFVAAFIGQHPEFAGIVDPSFTPKEDA